MDSVNIHDAWGQERQKFIDATQAPANTTFIDVSVLALAPTPVLPWEDPAWAPFFGGDILPMTNSFVPPVGWDDVEVPPPPKAIAINVIPPPVFSRKIKWTPTVHRTLNAAKAVAEDKFNIVLTKWMWISDLATTDNSKFSRQAADMTPEDALQLYIATLWMEVQELLADTPTRSYVTRVGVLRTRLNRFLYMLIISIDT